MEPGSCRGLGVGHVFPSFFLGRVKILAAIVLPQSNQPVHFSPVWICSCWGTALLSLNRIGHIEQA